MAGRDRRPPLRWINAARFVVKELFPRTRVPLPRGVTAISRALAGLVGQLEILEAHVAAPQAPPT